LRILSATSSLKKHLMASSFYAQPSPVIKELTDWSSGIGTIVSTIPSVSSGIQLSLEIETSFPSLILHSTPFYSSSFPCIILLHAKEADLGQLAVQKSLWGKYLPFITRAQRELGTVNNLQHCFPSIAWLKRAISLKPMPPRFLGADNHLQDFQCNFLLPSSTPHLKLEIGV
jgi:hypothetical protein